MTQRKLTETDDEPPSQPDEDELPLRDHLEWLTLLLGVIESLRHLL